MTDTIPDWAGKRACELLNAELTLSDWVWPRDCKLSPVRAIAKLVMQHEQPPIDPELVSMLGVALEEAFKKADPDCSHSFDWADFGPYGQTDHGKGVIEYLARAVSQYKQERSK